MVNTDAYREEGRLALPGASGSSRVRAAGSGLAIFASCVWLIAATTKTATSMFVDAPNHRTRRLWEPSQQP